MGRKFVKAKKPKLGYFDDFRAALEAGGDSFTMVARRGDLVMRATRSKLEQMHKELATTYPHADLEIMVCSVKKGGDKVRVSCGRRFGSRGDQRRVERERVHMRGYPTVSNAWNAMKHYGKMPDTAEIRVFIRAVYRKTNRRDLTTAIG